MLKLRKLQIELEFGLTTVAAQLQIPDTDPLGRSRLGNWIFLNGSHHTAFHRKPLVYLVLPK